MGTISFDFTSEVIEAQYLLNAVQKRLFKNLKFTHKKAVHVYSHASIRQSDATN